MKDAAGEQYTGEFVMLSNEAQDSVDTGSLHTQYQIVLPHLAEAEHENDKIQNVFFPFKISL